MLSFRFGVADAARVRLGYSPVTELMGALKFMQVPALARGQSPYLIDMWASLSDHDRASATALAPARGYIPDFLSPPPHASEPTLAMELERLAATPPATIDRELRMAHPHDLPPLMQRALDAPELAGALLAGTLARLWRATLAPRWPRARAALEADVAFRARQAAASGSAGVLHRPDHATRWEGDTLFVGSPSIDYDRDLDGRGIVAVSTLFSAPWPAIICFGDWQPALHLRVRGSPAMWCPDRPVVADDPLGELLGGTRARILRALEQPASTSTLAAEMGIHPGGVSRHLHALAGVGLARCDRHGRRVVYERTGQGDLLVADAVTDGQVDTGPPVVVPDRMA